MSFNLSIIIPHYNIPDYLKILLESIPCKDDIQVIVVDDRSTQYLNEYETLKSLYPHVSFIRNTAPGKGAGAARNVGLEFAQGKWLMFADADDTFLPVFYKAVSAWFDSEADIVFFPPTSTEADTGKVSFRHEHYMGLYRNYQVNQGLTNELAIRYMWHSPWSKLIKKELIQANNIVFHETPIENDTMFSVKAGYYAKNIELANETIYSILFRRQGISFATSVELITVRIHVFIEKYTFLKQRLDKEVFIRMPVHAIAFLGRQVVVNGYPLKEAIKIIGLFRQNSIRLWHKGFLNPRSLIRKVSTGIFRSILLRKRIRAIKKDTA